MRKQGFYGENLRSREDEGYWGRNLVVEKSNVGWIRGFVRFFRDGEKRIGSEGRLQEGRF